MVENTQTELGWLRAQKHETETDCQRPMRGLGNECFLEIYETLFPIYLLQIILYNPFFPFDLAYS